MHRELRLLGLDQTNAAALAQQAERESRQGRGLTADRRVRLPSSLAMHAAAQHLLDQTDAAALAQQAERESRQGRGLTADRRVRLPGILAMHAAAQRSYILQVPQ